MEDRWDILYRGPLSSCNYACGYCPFAKTRNTIAELRDDAEKLVRFIDWIECQAPREIGVLFTPWGEALIHRAYQQALLRLGSMPHVRRAAIQTNLAGNLKWLEDADRETLALWCTFHPTETKVEKFAAKIRQLRRLGIRHSVGTVGVKEHFPVITELRGLLPDDTYLWVNAIKKHPRYYGDEHVEFLSRIDPHFPVNLRNHLSQGKACRAGHTSFTVDGDGHARRCHFIDRSFGNIHDVDFAEKLRPRSCPNAVCRCHIGYANLAELKLDRIYGEGLLERIPASFNASAGSS
ncbi:STM4011 family radical SAM protein [Luteolibacter soli]|uniref:STM4011 family radical SAM protein n=1 Tax=Luteolibacter soli TaxID=3135280 RepID=A0ABU9B1G5_9BACT